MFVEADQAAHKAVAKGRWRYSAAKELPVRISRETRPGRRRHVQSRDSFSTLFEFLDCLGKIDGIPGCDSRHDQM